MILKNYKSFGKKYFYVFYKHYHSKKGYKYMLAIPRIFTAARTTKSTITNAERARRLASLEAMMAPVRIAAEKGNFNAIREMKNMEQMKALILSA